MPTINVRQAAMRSTVAMGLLLATQPSRAAPLDTAGYHALTTAWLPDKCFDLDDNQPILATCSNVVGQHWKLTAIKAGYYRLTTEKRGDNQCLDIVNDGKANNRPTLASCGDASGQHWKLTPVGSDYFTLTTEWRGDKKCLDVVNEGKASKLILADCANVSGQRWKIAALDRVVADRAVEHADLDGAIDTPDSFDPAFTIGFSADCRFSSPTTHSPRAGSDKILMMVCDRTKKTLICQVEHADDVKAFAFRAAISKDTGGTLAFATPQGVISVQINTKDRSSTLKQRVPGKDPVVCYGKYYTTADLNAAPVPEPEEPEAPSRQPSSRPEPKRTGPKKRGLGEMCKSTAECEGKRICTPRNRTRSVCE